MNLAPILDRLTEQCADDFAAIESVTGLNTLERGALPVVGVHPLRERAETENMVAGCVRQEIIVEIGVLIAAEAIDPATGDDPLDTARAAARGALLGYRATDWLDPLTLVNGEIISIDAARTLWRDTYRTRVLYTAAITHEATP